MARILLIDDDPDILKFTSRILTSHGHKVLLAKDADQAMDHITHAELDLIISDANMPHISGFELIKQIRGMKKFKDLPVALLTGRREREDVQRAIQVGVNDYIVKPINPKTLLEKVSSLLNQPRDKETISFNGDFIPLAFAQVDMRIVELGTQTLMLVSPSHFQKGQTLTLSSSVLTQANVGDLKCEITSVEADGKMYRIGAQWTALTEQQSRRLALWIRARIQDSKPKAA